MSLSELIAGVEDHEKTVTVFNAEPATVTALEERFEDRNVRVESERTESGRPGQFVTLSDDGEILAATDVADLRSALEGRGPTGIEESPYRPILEHLDETMFTSWGKRRMVASSREIEDRAWRVGAGRVFAGFQTPGVLAGELDVYERLGRQDIDVHAFATPDGDPPAHDAFTLHLERAREIADCWFVVFDGNGDDDQKCALVAEEREDGFYGFWTYDPGTVDWIIEYLESTYEVVGP